MYCVDDHERIRLAGDPYADADNQHLTVDIYPCKGDNCKTDEEIQLFLKQYTLLVVFYKQQTYQPDVYDNSVITKNYAIAYSQL